MPHPGGLIFLRGGACFSLPCDRAGGVVAQVIFPGSPQSRGRLQEFGDSSRPSWGAASSVPERRDESRRLQTESLRHDICCEVILARFLNSLETDNKKPC